MAALYCKIYFSIRIYAIARLNYFRGGRIACGESYRFAVPNDYIDALGTAVWEEFLSRYSYFCDISTEQPQPLPQPALFFFFPGKKERKIAYNAPTKSRKIITYWIIKLNSITLKFDTQ